MENAKSCFTAGTNYLKVGLADGWKMGGSAYNYAVTKKDGEEIFKNKLIVESEGAEARPVQKGVFNETNNYCYAYLRSVGNNWMYDPDIVHPKIKERLLKRFDTFDIDGDEVMTLDEIKKWPERMRSLCNANDEQVEKMKAGIEIFFTCHGVHPIHGCKREHYIENNRIFAEYERERIRQGLQPIIHVLAESYFDVLDSDHNGYLTFSELQTMMLAFEVPVDAADSFFAVCDTNGDGKLEYDEMHIQFVKFWFSEYDPTLDHIFADKY
jgi:Ca2+-binding EF-hand superfamily protein